MKRFGLALAALFAAMAFGAPQAAFAATKAEPYSKEQIAQGKKDLPAVVQTIGLPCTVTDAASLGEGMAKNPDDPKAKEVKVKNYEVACQQGMGYIIQNYEALTPRIYDCVSLAETPSPCRLPENTDPKKLLAALVSAAGKTCSINQERALGGTKAGIRFYEVSCTEGSGYIIETQAPTSNTPPVAEDCARHVGTNLECKFTTKEQIAAAMNARLAPVVAASGKTCQITASREVGSDSAGDTYYEVACGPAVGYMIAEKGGQFVRAIDCAKAGGIGGGCTLTDATQAESAETGTYTRLAKAGGFQCDVAKYRFIGVDTKSNSEVVELQCSNRADGTVALFPTDNKGQAKFLDCIEAGVLGQTCKLNDPSATYSKYTQALAAKGKKTCTVSHAQWLAATQAGENFIETACSDGLPGWVLVMTPQGSASDVLTCGQVKSSGVTCSLPGNTK
jgi:hypothetical protein